jgi:hypothetical protein
MLEEDTEAGAKPCCTSDGACGGQSNFMFGEACVPRFGPPGQLDNAACPDEFPIFLDLEGCCRPDGSCGLSADHVNNWDIGCIERTAMETLLNEGKTDRQNIASLTFLGAVDVDYEAISCVYAGE